MHRSCAIHGTLGQLEEAKGYRGPDYVYFTTNCDHSIYVLGKSPYLDVRAGLPRSTEKSSRHQCFTTQLTCPRNTGGSR